jgi:hypothetical protein
MILLKTELVTEELVVLPKIDQFYEMIEQEKPETIGLNFIV